MCSENEDPLTYCIPSKMVSPSHICSNNLLDILDIII